MKFNFSTTPGETSPMIFKGPGYLSFGIGLWFFEFFWGPGPLPWLEKRHDH